MADLYGDLKGFRDRFPADKLEQFRQSKNLSNISAKRAVSCALGPTEITRPLATELLRTCDFSNQINKHNVQVVPYTSEMIYHRGGEPDRAMHC